MLGMDQTDPDSPGLSAVPPDGAASSQQAKDPDLDRLLRLVARGDQQAFEVVYDQLARPAYGVIRRVLRDPAQSEEVTQEVLLEVWRTASRFDPARGSAATWVLTIAHRRAIDRVRSSVAATEREQKTVWAGDGPPSADEVAEAVEASLDRERLQRCLGGLTDVQRESITLAYYGGYTYRQVAALLDVTLAAIKTRIRDGLIRMRDCLGVS
jgi:RNA polymerase sigma-70 factor, ECF subfamily